MNTNFSTYSSQKVVKHYAEYSKKLQPPEQTIFNLLGSRLGYMKMLDIGVGGGRTTTFFASLVKEYIGIDFSEGMIKACQEKFKSDIPNAKFEVCDVRDLSYFKSHYFDLVLFSFNGIDNITPEERMNVLKEIRRICSPQGVFCFSSHNLQYLPVFFKIHFRLHLFKFIKSLIGRKKLIKQNKDSITNLNSKNFVSIYDDVYDFGLHTCYIKPFYQVEMLHDSGFNNVRLFKLTNGLEMKDKSEFDQTMDPWIYYLCK